MSLYKSIGFGVPDVTKPYKFIGFGAKPYECIGFGTMGVTKPYKPMGAPLVITRHSWRERAPRRLGGCPQLALAP